MTVRNFAYDHPSYTARQVIGPILTVANNGTSSKFVAHANMQIYGVTGVVSVAGTSTVTATQPPAPSTATTQVVANGGIYNLFRITNTAAYGTTVALSTTTYGPFIGGQLFSNGTFTAAVGHAFQYPVNSLQIVASGTTLPNSGLTNQGGIAVSQGDILYVVTTNTDASQVSVLAFDYQIQPLASVTA